MASHTKSLPTHEIDFLKETLHAQQELLQKLYNELDEEREASSVAADEALSMILRLQGEKSALEMEASQYKRIAEEKMSHAQETLEIFQELIYQKEMQIASLEFQVQAYKFKLMSMGCDDLVFSETQYPENILSRKNGESSSRGSYRRGSSLPPPPVNGTPSRRVSTEAWQEIKAAETSVRKEPGDFNSYWEEMRKLDDRVKELDNLKSSNSFPSTMDTNYVFQSSVSPIQIPSPENSSTASDFFKSPENVNSAQSCGDSPCSPSVQDIFEVPICSYDNQGNNPIEKETLTLPMENEKRNEKLNSDWNHMWKSEVREKEPLVLPTSNKISSETNDAKEKIEWEKKWSSDASNESPKPKDSKTDKAMFYKHPTYGVADFELQQFNRRLEQLEDQRFMMRGDKPKSETTAEEMRVLLEIREEIDSLKDEITSWRTTKLLPPADRSPGCLKEVLLCFWP